MRSGDPKKRRSMIWIRLTLVVIATIGLARAFYAEHTALIALGFVAGLVLIILNILEMRSSE